MAYLGCFIFFGLLFSAVSRFAGLRHVEGRGCRAAGVVGSPPGHRTLLQGVPALLPGEVVAVKLLDVPTLVGVVSWFGRVGSPARNVGNEAYPRAASVRITGTGRGVGYVEPSPETPPP